MNPFSFQVPQEIHFGEKSIQKLPELLKKEDPKKILLISDRGLEKAGTVQKILDVLEQSGIERETYLDVLPNPTVKIVDEVTALYRTSGADCIIALGGGSPMDVAKAVGILARYGGSITEYEGAEKVPGPIVPIVAVPTTAGTGSEVTAFSVITDTEHNYKLSVFSYKIIPKYAVLDPELIYSLPQAVAASTGIDAMIHALEAYVSRGASPFSDAMAEKALELIGANIRPFTACRQDKEAACAMLTGSMFAGIAFAWARLGNVHAMSHPVSAFYGVAHGVANSVLLPAVLEYNALADRGRYEIIYNYIKKSSGPSENFVPRMLVEEIYELLDDFGIPRKLSDLGVEKEVVPRMAADAMKSGNILANPRQTTQKDIEQLYYSLL